MASGSGQTAWQRGRYFLACFLAGPLIGWGLGWLTGGRGGWLGFCAVTLPAVVMVGYGLWHLRRILRVVRLRIRGAALGPDDPVAEHAPESFQVAGAVVAAGTVLVGLLTRHGWAGLALAVAAIAFGAFLASAARSGRLPAPEVD